MNKQEKNNPTNARRGNPAFAFDKVKKHYKNLSPSP